MEPRDLYELSAGDRDATMMDTDIANAVIRGVKRVDNIKFSPEGSGVATVGPDNILITLYPTQIGVRTTGDLNGEPASCIMMAYEKPKPLPVSGGGSG